MKALHQHGLIKEYIGKDLTDRMDGVIADFKIDSMGN